MQLSERTWLIGLLSIFVIALGIRVGATIAFVGLDAPPDAGANPDQLDYEMLGARLAAGDGFTLPDGTPTARRSPGTALALAPAYLLHGHSYAQGRLWFCYLSAATCLAVAYIVVQVFSRMHALVAAGMLAVYPGHFYYAMHFVSETPYCLALALAVGLSIHALRHGGWKATIGAGLFWGLAMLTRSQLVLLLPIGAFALAAVWKWTPRVTWRRAVRQYAMQAAIIAAVLAPWLVRNHVQLGKPTMTTIAGHGLWGCHNELTLTDTPWRGTWVKTSDLEKKYGALPAGEVAADEEAWRRGAASIREHAGAIPAVVAAKLWRFVSPVMDTPNAAVKWAFALSWLCVAPFVIVGAWQTLRRARGPAIIALLPLAATVATVVLFYGSVRFRDSLAPLFIAAAGVAVTQLAIRIAKAWFGASANASAGVVATIRKDDADQRQAA